jgi:AbrB family looped-hinge helix DNA binding protein
MTEVTVSAKNQIVIPREARKALGLKPGDKFLSLFAIEESSSCENPSPIMPRLEG